jgi:hypothetical protein
MIGRWPFKKTQDVGASSSSVAKKKAPLLKKDESALHEREDRAGLYDQNASVGLRDIHIPSGWHLNDKRVSVPLWCLVVGGHGGMRSGTGGLSFHQIYARTQGLRHGLGVVRSPCL